MKIWTKIKLTDKNRNVELIAKSLSNYLYMFGPLDKISNKYKIEKNDRKILEEYTANRIAGLLMLYLANDTKRINDIVNKYNLDIGLLKNIIPEIEGYINK